MAGYVERVAAGSSPFLDRPRPLAHLDIELTERCNNDCVHCCINLPARDEGACAREMTGVQVSHILDEAAALGALSVRFTGGEPLLREDFPDIYAHARKLGLQVIVFTNARRVTPALADLWARMPPRQPVEITAYGLQSASYEAVTRTAGSFAEFRRGVELLRERGIPFVLKGVVLPATSGELEQFRQWAATVAGQSRPPGMVAFLDLRQRRDSEEKNRRIRALRLAPHEGLAVLRRVGGEDLQHKRAFCSRFMGAQGPRLFACEAGKGIAVDAYGRVQACLGLRAPELSCDVLHGSLAQALRDFFPRIRTLEATDPAYLERCARCFLKGLCEQCPAKSWAEHGTLDTPVEYLCDIAHAEARELGLLQEGEKSWQVSDPEARLARLVVPK